MYKILIVDDETAAIEYIGRIIEKSCEGFETADTARSAEEAWTLLENKNFDVLITDIKMGGITGIELAERIRKKNPGIQIIIISGYSEFKYAKKAISSNVFEYTLKPVDPDEFACVMKRLKTELDQELAKRKLKVLSAVYRGENTDMEMLRELFWDAGYYAILFRKNGLPNRFNEFREVDITSGVNGSTILYGRDEDEAFYLFLEECADSEEHLLQMAQSLQKKYCGSQDFCTIVISREAFPVWKMAEAEKEMYRILNRNIVLGKNQTLFAGEKEKTVEIDHGTKELIKRTEYFIEKDDTQKAKETLKDLCSRFEKMNLPQIQVINIIRQICNYVWMSQGYSNYDVNQEYVLEDLFSSSVTMQMLYESICEFAFPSGEQKNQKIDTEEYFNRMKEYVCGHLSDPLTINSIVRIFAISQSSLSYMFRKYTGLSFNNYLTKQRIEYAKEIMRSQRDILIRDLAQLAGYQDQFYFSKVFKIQTGMSPSDYIQKLEEK